MGEKDFGTLHIYGVRAIFGPYVITKTLNLSHLIRELSYINQYHPIKISKALLENDIHTPQDGSKILRQSLIFIEQDPFL